MNVGEGWASVIVMIQIWLVMQYYYEIVKGWREE